ncbi:hypothetical protein OXX80_006927 [Metschnikowia pulcherrima]
MKVYRICLFVILALIQFCCARSKNMSEVMVGNESKLLRSMEDAVQAAARRRLNKHRSGSKIKSTERSPSTILSNQARKHLRRFLRFLRGFIHDSTFEYMKFSSQISDLSEELAGIEAIINEYGYSRKTLLQQLEFTKHMLRVMIDSTELMQFYEPENGLAQGLIFKVIQLNVKLLTMCDSRGNPNPYKKGYENDVYRFVNLLASWRDLFRARTQEPASTKLAFEQYSGQARRTLRVMLRNIKENIQ